MTLPTTNLLEYINKRADAIAKQQGTTNPYEMTDVNSLVEYRVLMEIEIRILQERENEKAVIVKSHSDGVVDAILVEINECKISSETYYQQTYKSIQTTFNPNK